MVPNLYPALDPDSPEPRLGRPTPSCSGPGPRAGAHEVIVNAPQSVSSLGELAVEQVALAMDVWRERMRAHADAACLHLIVNERREAGASLPHTHAQLYALDFVPAAIARERERFGAYATQTMGGNLLADLVQQEVRQRERIVAIDDEAVLMAALRGPRPLPAAARPADAAAALRGRRAHRRGAAPRRPGPAGRGGSARARR